MPQQTIKALEQRTNYQNASTNYQKPHSNEQLYKSPFPTKELDSGNSHMEPSRNQTKVINHCRRNKETKYRYKS